ncbi:MAG: MATE family efflux transporter [Spirochaetia bacterium]|jgi:putative MATE family efflux protein|nr:MATE family efflux transporter [Spirochaetia bacterium]
MQTMSRYEAMTTKPVEGLVLRLAGPSLAIMMISAMYNMADTYFVGSLGTSATASLGISFSLMALVQAVGFFFGQGAGSFIARALGAQDNENASRMAATGFFSSFIAGALIAAVGLVFLTPLCALLGATPTIMPYARQYLQFILLGAPFMTSSLTQNNLLRFQGSSFYAMLGMVSGAVLNVGLDPLFIFGLDMGVRGASLATMISQMVSCGILFFVSCRQKESIGISLKNFSPRWTVYREMLRGGFPSLLRQGIASIAVVFLNRAAGGFGDAVIAAVSIVNRVVLFATAALLGFGQGFQPVCGFNYGAKRYDRVKKAFWFCMKICSSALVVFAALGFVFAPEIIALFRRDDPEVIRVGVLALRVYCFPFPFLGWVILNNMMMQVIGKAVPASILALSRQGLFLVPLVFLLERWLGVLGIQIAMPIADFCTFLLALPLGLGILRGMKEGSEKNTDGPWVNDFVE